MKQSKHREELQNRTVNPSSGSWERLSMKLDSPKVRKKGIKLQFLKYAAAILILISIGFYFSEPKEKEINSPIIVAPTLKKQLDNIPEINIDPQTEVAVKPEIYTIEKNINPEPIIPSNKEKFSEEEVAYAPKENETFVIPVTENISSTRIINNIKTETLLSEEKVIDDEVTRLLNESKIRLLLKNPITSKNVVSAQALLNEVEGDLDKALKEKLMEKIANILNNPKEVVTFQEN